MFLAAAATVSARAAVLEELDDGTILHIENASADNGRSTSASIAEGAADDATRVSARLSPSGLKDVSASSTAVVVDDGPDRSALVAARTSRALPRPRGLSPRLSPQQNRMRALSMAVAHRFARAPGVRRARLDRQTFVVLFTTMIQRESNFRINAVSPAGAKGLGQLMPGTARALGVCDVFSPHDNLGGAASYLTAMLEQFGSPALALAAYNAGPSAVRRYGGVPPFRETRQYVADILHAMENTRTGGFDRPVDLLTDSADRPSGSAWLSSYSATFVSTRAPRSDCTKRGGAGRTAVEG